MKELESVKGSEPTLDPVPGHLTPIRLVDDNHGGMVTRQKMFVGNSLQTAAGSKSTISNCLYLLVLVSKQRSVIAVASNVCVT